VVVVKYLLHQAHLPFLQVLRQLKQLLWLAVAVAVQQVLMVVVAAVVVEVDMLFNFLLV